MPKPIRCYDYVNQPFEKVCEVLRADSNAVFRAATTSAESRASEIAAGLHVKIAGFDISKHVEINIEGFTETETKAGKTLTVHLDWKAAETARLFPVMTARLNVYPLTRTETQLDFEGEYEPPLGLMGKAINAIVGHRIADASVHHFLSEVAAYLRTNAPSVQSPTKN